MNIQTAIADYKTVLEKLIGEGQISDPTSPKGKLLKEAAHLFSTKGYERTTVRDIAKEVGIQSGSIFHHYKSKEDILKAVMTDAVILNTARMQAALDVATNPKEKILALIRCELDGINGVTGEAMGILVYEWRSLSPENQQDILELREIYENLWLDSIEAGRKAGIVKGEAFILRRLIQGALSWTYTWYKREGQMTMEQLAEQALLMAVRD